MTTPLTELADQRAKRAGEAETAIDTRSRQLASDLEGARTSAAVATAKLVTLRQVEAELRAMLGVAPLPADVDHLTDELEQTLVAQLGAVADVATAADALGAAQREHARSLAALTAARTAAAAAAAAATSVHEETARIDGWRTALVGPEVSDALAAARTATRSEPYTKARDRLLDILDKPLPPDKKPDVGHPLGLGMLDLLATRGREAAARLTAVTDSADRAADAAGTAVSDATTARDALVARLQEVAVGAVSAVAGAARVCQEIADARLPTSAEQGRLDGLHAAALDAGDKQREVFAAAADVRDVRQTFDVKVLAKVKADPAFDPDSSAEVAVERKAVEDAVKEHAGAQQAFKAVGEDIDVWQVAVPEEVKAQVVAFLDAGDVLDRLTEVDAPNHITALGAADQKLADALRAEDTIEAVGARLEGEAVVRTAEAAAARAVARDRRVALVRGEG